MNKFSGIHILANKLMVFSTPFFHVNCQLVGIHFIHKLVIYISLNYKIIMTHKTYLTLIKPSFN